MPKVDNRVEPSQDLYAILRPWQRAENVTNLLHFLANRSRRDILSDLQVLSPVIADLGGENAVTEIFRAIQDVGRWWP